jgi:hypothetical protein
LAHSGFEFLQAHSYLQGTGRLTQYPAQTPLRQGEQEPASSASFAKQPTQPPGPRGGGGTNHGGILTAPAAERVVRRPTVLNYAGLLFQAEPRQADAAVPSEICLTSSCRADSNGNFPATTSIPSSPGFSVAASLQEAGEAFAQFLLGGAGPGEVRRGLEPPLGGEVGHGDGTQR